MPPLAAFLLATPTDDITPLKALAMFPREGVQTDQSVENEWPVQGGCTSSGTVTVLLSAACHSDIMP